MHQELTKLADALSVPGMTQQFMQSELDLPRSRLSCFSRGVAPDDWRDTGGRKASSDASYAARSTTQFSTRWPSSRRLLRAYLSSDAIVRLTAALRSALEAHRTVLQSTSGETQWWLTTLPEEPAEPPKRKRVAIRRKQSQIRDA